jgi:hypothetical protein
MQQLEQSHLMACVWIVSIRYTLKMASLGDKQYKACRHVIWFESDPKPFIQQQNRRHKIREPYM